MDPIQWFVQAVDPVLIAPYRWVEDPAWGWWLGSLVLALWSTVLGELTLGVVYRLNGKQVRQVAGEMVSRHNLSLQALQAGDKQAYRALNKQANEAFGKSFFAGAALFSVSVWPVPFALAWLATRFDGVDVPIFPGHAVRYNAVFLGFYILLRLAMWPLWQKLPVLGRVERTRREMASRRAKLRPWTDLGKPDKA